MSTNPRTSPQSDGHTSPSSAGLLVFAWIFVGIPLSWGVWQTIVKSLALFH